MPLLLWDASALVNRYYQSVADLENQVLASPDFGVLSIEDDRVLTGLDLVTRHSLNTSDAAILGACLRYARSLPPGSPSCILIAADRRLLRVRHPSRG